jgi:hypothetical protein
MKSVLNDPLERIELEMRTFGIERLTVKGNFSCVDEESYPSSDTNGRGIYDYLKYGNKRLPVEERYYHELVDFKTKVDLTQVDRDFISQYIKKILKIILSRNEYYGNFITFAKTAACNEREELRRFLNHVEEGNTDGDTDFVGKLEAGIQFLQERLAHVRRIDDLVLPEKEDVLRNFKESLILPEGIRFEDYVETSEEEGEQEDD